MSDPAVSEFLATHPDGKLWGYLGKALRSYSFRYRDEKQFQDGLERVLGTQQFPYRREFRLNDRDVIDFLIGDAIGLEVKVDGSLSAVTRQMHRYAADPQLAALALVTTRRAHDRMPATLRGKPMQVIVMGGYF